MGASVAFMHVQVVPPSFHLEAQPRAARAAVAAAWPALIANHVACWMFKFLASSSHMDWTSEKCWCMVCVLVEIISCSLHPAQSKNLAKGLQKTFQRT